MSRHQGFDVRVAPEVEQAIWRLAQQRGAASIHARHIRRALSHLGREGTRASGAKKLQSLDLWEIRAGDYRVFFAPVPRTNALAVAAMAPKTKRRLPMAQLRRFEAKVYRWRDELEETT